MISDSVNLGDAMVDQLLANAGIDEALGKLGVRYLVKHFRPSKSGRLHLLDEDLSPNLVPYQGKNKAIDCLLKSAAQIGTWYMGLKGTGSPANGDTAQTHAGWSEINPYSGNRPSITWGTTSNGSNTGTAVQYTITSGTTVYGAFIVSVATGGGAGDFLLSASDFASSRVVAINDVLSVTPTLSA